MKSPVLFSIAFLLAGAVFVFGRPQSGESQLSSTEKWVLAKLSAGEVADLREQFAEERMRTVSAAFLTRLLTGILPGFKPHPNGVRIIGAIIHEPVYLYGAKISEARMESCRFDNDVTFANTIFTEMISFDNTKFSGNAIFADTKAERSLYFRRAAFAGSALFTRAEITGQFVADEADFSGSVSFYRARVAQTINLQRAHFRSGANFGGTQVGGDFIVDDAQFEQEGFFNGLKIKGNAYLIKTFFKRSANFAEADIENNFDAEDSRFGDTARLDLSCGRTGNFAGAKFDETAYFAESNFGSLFIDGKDSATSTISRLNLASSSIKRRLDIRKVTIKDLAASLLRVEGKAQIKNVTVESADLTYSDFGVLDLSDSVWPKDRQFFRMEGLRFKYIRAAPEEPDSHKALLGLANQSVYAADVYRSLEEFFSRQGYRDDADRVFIASKRREQEFRHSVRWLGVELLERLVGYGRSPLMAALNCAYIVALGCLLFSRKRMERRKPEEVKESEDPLLGYSRLWYSLGLFLPFVDLQSDKVWRPKDDQRFLRHYMRFHILLGWVLVPFFLTTLALLIK